MSLETTAGPSSKPIKIAILAMGGEGGGVLADWIVDMAESQGFYAQSTSVPGVAQRTGATIYYVEVLPVLRTAGLQPFFGLMPTPGDVDVVIASELMESARAVQRGLVTPDKTLLITSSHRVYAMPEKMALGDGRADIGQFVESGRKAAQYYVSRDFAALAERCGSVISATLFGALAAAAIMPWSRGAFEAAIERGGVGVATSLKAFGAGYDAFLEDERPILDKVKPAAAATDERLAALVERVRREYPADCFDTIVHGLARTADYQDLAYAGFYLTRLADVHAADRRWGQGNWRMTRETARYLALWMTFEDTARVAELKLRKHRFERVRREVRASDQQLMHINEYFHPRAEEIADTLPSPLGRWLLRSGPCRGLLERLTRKGRVIRTSALGGFLMLYAVASCRRFRRSSLRYERENTGIQDWLARICRTAAHDYALACEIVECQRLIKGYGDTHARGATSYALILASLDDAKQQDAGQVRRLRDAALADDSGAMLRNLLAAAKGR